jgi:hypothetical protein
MIPSTRPRASNHRPKPGYSRRPPVRRARSGPDATAGLASAYTSAVHLVAGIGLLGTVRARSLLGAAAMVRNVGAYRLTGEKPDKQAETRCTKGKRDILVCRGDPRRTPQA